MNEEFNMYDNMTAEQESAPEQQEPNAAPEQSDSQPKPKKKKKKIAGIIALVLVFAILGGVGGSFLTLQYQKLSRAAFAEQKAAEAFEEVPLTKFKTVVGDKSLTPADVYAQNVDSVVGIVMETTTTNIFGQVSSAVCGGSGFVFTEDGYIVTNAHVVEGAKSIKVTMHNGDEHEAKLIGSYAANDIALLKIDAKGLQAVTIGKSSDLVVGEQVVAIGNPLFELTYSLTVGYVSALSRSTNIDGTPMNVLQTDVAINSGNSGGPLFDMNGNVVGITNAKRTGKSSSGALIEGISFSIPIDDVLDMLKDIAANGRVTGLPYMGVLFRDLDSSLADIYKLPVGPYITEIVEGSAADKAGLKTGDIVLKMGDVAVKTRSEALLALQRYRAGDSLVLTVFRDGGEMQVSIVLDERPQEEEAETGQPQVQPQQQTPNPGSQFGFPFDFFFGY